MAGYAARFPLLTPFMVAGMTNLSMNASGVASGNSFYVNKAGTVDRFLFYCSGVTSPPTYRVRVCGVASSRPDNTNAWANSDATITPSAGWNLVNLTTPNSVSLNQALAATIFYDSGTIDASHFINLHRGNAGYSLRGTINTTLGIPALYTASAYTTWTTTSVGGVFSFGPMLSDGTCLGFVPISTPTATTITSGQYAGNTFTPDFVCDCQGVVSCGRMDGANSYKLLDSSNNVLASTTLTSGFFTTGSTTNQQVLFSSPVRLYPGRTYRVVVLASGSSQSLDVRDWYTSTDYLNYCQGSPKRTTSTDGTTWTDDATKLTAISPIITIPFGSGFDLTKSPLVGK